MKVLIAASEIATLAQTGGLADVMRSLPIALKKKGIECALVMPKYRQVKGVCEDLGEIRIPIEEKFVVGRLHRTELDHSGIPVYLVEQENYFNREQLYTEKGRDYPDNLERYTFFCRAALEFIARGIWPAELIHANDWQTSLLPIYSKTLFKNHPVLGKIKTLLTIHNLSYQGLFPVFLYPILGLGWEHFNLSELEYYNQINLLKGGIVFADAVNTVSPTYAKEIQTPQYGNGMDGILREKSQKITGILNRVDYAQWSPENDIYISTPYTIDTVVKGKAANKKALLKEFGLPILDTRKPLFGVVSRITSQKGCDQIASIIPSLIRHDAQIIIQGVGDPKIEDALKSLQRQYPNACQVHIAYDTRMSHWIEAGADIFLMPSRFEPCGLNQMYSLRYGTIPIVREIGGLADTILDVSKFPEGNGFTFAGDSPDAFMEACNRALTLFENEADWLKLIERGMKIDFSWDRSAVDYIQLYQAIL